LYLTKKDFANIVSLKYLLPASKTGKKMLGTDAKK